MGEEHQATPGEVRRLTGNRPASDQTRPTQTCVIRRNPVGAPRRPVARRRRSVMGSVILHQLQGVRGANLLETTEVFRLGSGVLTGPACHLLPGRMCVG